jgi:phosphatidylglycerophosphate synthase
MGRSVYRWLHAHAICMLVAATLALMLKEMLPVVLTGLASFLACAIVFYPSVRHLSPPGGIPNIITMSRLAFFVGCVLLVGIVHPYVFTAGIIVVLVADGLDGYFARRLGQSTEVGALLDMEVDAFIGCTLAFVGYFLFDLSIIVLVAGAMRYAFVLFRWVMRWSGRKVAVPGARTVAILFFISLLTPFILGMTVGYWATWIGSGLILYSFTRETMLLFLQSRSEKSRT